MLPRDFVSVFVGLGSNLGNSQETVEAAIRALSNLPQTQMLSCSSFYQSAPVEAEGPEFVNAVVHFQTRLNAFDLLRACQAIENLAGRERHYVNSPRTLDVDLLIYGDARIDSEFLKVPHPRMQERAFVLHPLRELAPEKVLEADLNFVSGQAIRKIR